MTQINYITSVQPDYSFQTPEIFSYAKEHWFSKMDALTARKAEKILKGAQIDSRSSVEPLDVVFGDESFEEKNNRYVKAVKKLSQRLLQKAFDESGYRPEEIDYIITVSCTGFMIPSVDAYFLQEFSFRSDVMRLPVTEMGCAGGMAGIQYAREFLKNNKEKKVALVMALETPSLTFCKDDHSAENLVSTAIFADGASAVILSNRPSVKGKSLTISSIGNYHFPSSNHYMGYNLTNKGLKIVLDKEVPIGINAHLPKIIDQFLSPVALSLSSLDYFLLHPGGKKIIQSVESYIAPQGKNVDYSKEVLKTRGNMSSATVLHIIERSWQNFLPKQQALSFAFGPGFSAIGITLKNEVS